MAVLTENQKLIAQGVLNGSLNPEEKFRVLGRRFGWSPSVCLKLESDLRPSSPTPVDNFDAHVALVWENAKAGAPAGPTSWVPGPAPLSSSQIFPDEDSAEITWAGGGRVARVKFKGQARKGGGRRQAVEWFTVGSRNRLLGWVNAIDRSQTEAGDWVFVTLTYPETFPAARKTKADLERFLKRFDRRWGEHPMFWKLEPQKRGAAHYHLLVRAGRRQAAESRAAELAAWVAETWVEVVNPADPADRVKMLRFHQGQAKNARPCVEAPKSWNGVVSYTGKYLGKVVEELDTDPNWVAPGRFWGIRHRALLPVEINRLGLRAVHECVALSLRRLMRQWFNRQASGMCRVYLGTGPAVKMSVKQAGEFARRYPRARVVPIRRKWRRSSGGISCFLPAADFERLLAWACQVNGFTVDDLYSFDPPGRKRQLSDQELSLPRPPWAALGPPPGDPLPF